MKPSYNTIHITTATTPADLTIQKNRLLKTADKFHFLFCCSLLFMLLTLFTSYFTSVQQTQMSGAEMLFVKRKQNLTCHILTNTRLVSPLAAAGI